MQTKPKSNQDLRADEVYKMVGAIGFLLNSFDELNRLSNFNQKVFSNGLKYAANKFKAELEKAERIFTDSDFEKSEVMMQQMADSYQVVNNLLVIMLQAGRILTPEAMDLMNNDLYATARKWGVVVESIDVYTQPDKTE